MRKKLLTFMSCLACLLAGHYLPPLLQASAPSSVDEGELPAKTQWPEETGDTANTADPAQVRAEEEQALIEQTRAQVLAEIAQSEAQQQQEKEQSIRQEEAQSAYLALCRRAFSRDFTFACRILQAPREVLSHFSAPVREASALCRYRTLLERNRNPYLRFPVPVPSMQMLRLTLEQKIAGLEGTWSVYVKNLKDQTELAINDRSMKSASVMKLFVMGAVYQAIAQGELERTGEVVSRLEAMISSSSNEDSNQLLSLLGDGDYALGIHKVNQFIQENGYSARSHEFNGFQSDATVLDSSHSNRIAARDCARLLEQIYRRDFLSWSVCSEIEGFMLNQHTRYKIPAGVERVASGVKIGNKTGEMDHVENDVAIVYSPRADYILCIFSDGWENKDSAQKSIQDLSEEVYRYFNEEDWALRHLPLAPVLIDPDMEPFYTSSRREAASLPEESEEETQPALNPMETVISEIASTAQTENGQALEALAEWMSEEASEELLAGGLPEEALTEWALEGTSVEERPEETLVERASLEDSSEGLPEEALTECASEQASSEGLSEEALTEWASEQASSEGLPEEALTEWTSEQASSEGLPEETLPEGLPVEDRTERASEKPLEDHPSENAVAEQAAEENKGEHSMKLWGKIWKNNHIIKDTVVVLENNDTRTHLVFQALDELCLQFDLGRPIWLEPTIREFRRHSKARFTQDCFVEQIDFDYLEIQVLEE